jgi:signal transduction histidine kinase
MIPRSVRARLLLAAVASLSVALVLLAVAFNLVLDHRLNAEADSLLRARAAAALSAVRVDAGHPVMPEAPDAAAPTNTVWVFDGQTPVELPHASAAVDRRARAMAAAPTGGAEVPGQAIRLLSVPVLDHGSRVGTVVAAVSLSPYEDARRTALIGSIVLVVLVGLLFTVSGAWILRRALAPVSQMTSDAAEWSEHDLDRRFDLGPPRDELSQLGATLDDLLGRLVASLRREQRVSAEISHELRTPLARIQAEADLMLRRRRTSAEYSQALTGIRQNAMQMASIIDALMDAARHEPDRSRAICDLTDVSRSAVLASNPLAESAAVSLEIVAPDSPVRARVERPLAERILQPLIENACRHARSRVAVEVDATDRYARVSITDDGNGIPAGSAEAAFEPGARAPDSTGAGLGLALARRLARAGSGDVVAGSGPGGEFVVTLPIVPS